MANNTLPPYDPQTFSEPYVKTVEIPILAAPAPGQYSVAEFRGEDLEFDVDAYVERVTITEDHWITQNPGVANLSILPLIFARWWMSQGQQAYGEFVPLPAMDNRRPAISPVQVVGVGGTSYQQIEMEMRGPRMLGPQEAIFFEWSNPSVAGAVAMPAGQIHAAFHGHLLESGRPYHLFIPINVAASGVAGGALVADQTSPTNAGRNRSGETFIIARKTLTFNSTSYPASATDANLFRHIRLMPVFGKNRRWAKYGDRAPVVAFGDLLTVPQQSVDMNFRGHEIPINEDGGIQFEFRNYATSGTQLIATFWSWRKPNPKAE